MKTIIAGSRCFSMYSTVLKAVAESGWGSQITEVVSGTAIGPDTNAIKFAAVRQLPCKQFPADWIKHSKAAGIIRNKAMARYADALIAIWDGTSKGTADMIVQARKHGLKVYVHKPPQSENDGSLSGSRRKPIGSPQGNQESLLQTGKDVSSGPSAPGSD